MKPKSLIRHTGNVREESYCTSMQTCGGLHTTNNYVTGFLLNDDPDGTLNFKL